MTWINNPIKSVAQKELADRLIGKYIAAEGFNLLRSNNDKDPTDVLIFESLIALVGDYDLNKEK